METGLPRSLAHVLYVLVWIFQGLKKDASSTNVTTGPGAGLYLLSLRGRMTELSMVHVLPCKMGS